MDDKIVKAIEAGKLERKNQMDVENDRKEKLRKVHLEYIEQCKKNAKIWAENTLPSLITEETSKGNNSAFIGSSDHANKDHDVLCKVAEAEKLGLKIRGQSYNADPGEEGCYSHGDGCSYYIEW